MQVSKFRGKPLLYVGIAAIIALTIAIPVAWNNGVRDYFFPRAFRTIEPDAVYASGQINRHLIANVINQYHIRRIVSLTDDGPNQPDEAAERQVAQQMGVEYFLFPLDGDGTGDIRNYERTLVQVTRAMNDHAPILVHCFSGAQRTRGWIAFFRLLVEHRTPEQVKAELTASGWREPASRQLYPYINQHIAELASLLVGDRVIPSIPQPMPQLDP